MKPTENFYAVELPSNLPRGTKRLAIGTCSAGPALFYWRDHAAKLKNALAADGFPRARVVKVRVTYRW
jgi:hypothetical protein